MDYRDERDALRGRVENLEEQLDEARLALAARRDGDEAERVARLEEQLVEAQALIQRLRRASGVTEDDAAPREAAAPGAEVEATTFMVVGGLAGSVGAVLALGGLCGLSVTMVSDAGDSPERGSCVVVMAIGSALLAVFLGTIFLELWRRGKPLGAWTWRKTTLRLVPPVFFAAVGTLVAEAASGDTRGRTFGLAVVTMWISLAAFLPAASGGGAAGAPEDGTRTARSPSEEDDP